MNRKWGIRILFLVFAITMLASVVRTATPATITVVAINEGYAAPSSANPHTDLDRINATTLTCGHAADQKNNVPFHPVAGTGHRNPYVSTENLHIRESSYLVKDYLFFIYPSHHFW